MGPVAFILLFARSTPQKQCEGNFQCVIKGLTRDRFVRQDDVLKHDWDAATIFVCRGRHASNKHGFVVPRSAPFILDLSHDSDFLPDGQYLGHRFGVDEQCFQG